LKFKIFKKTLFWSFVFILCIALFFKESNKNILYAQATTVKSAILAKILPYSGQAVAFATFEIGISTGGEQGGMFDALNAAKAALGKTANFKKMASATDIAGLNIIYICSDSADAGALITYCKTNKATVLCVSGAQVHVDQGLAASVDVDTGKPRITVSTAGSDVAKFNAAIMAMAEKKP
jgi:hypothetical protein